MLIHTHGKNSPDRQGVSGSICLTRRRGGLIRAPLFEHCVAIKNPLASLSYQRVRPMLPFDVVDLLTDQAQLGEHFFKFFV
jgi:hypothetical protein